MMWGVLIGGIIFGLIADKYGRKIPLMIGITIQCIASYITSVLPWYWLFLVSWFILALASGGIGIISFVLSMEVRRILNGYNATFMKIILYRYI